MGRVLGRLRVQRPVLNAVLWSLSCVYALRWSCQDSTRAILARLSTTVTVDVADLVMPFVGYRCSKGYRFNMISAHESSESSLFGRVHRSMCSRTTSGCCETGRPLSDASLVTIHNIYMSNKVSCIYMMTEGKTAGARGSRLSHVSLFSSPHKLSASYRIRDLDPDVFRSSLPCGE